MKPTRKDPQQCAALQYLRCDRAAISIQSLPELRAFIETPGEHPKKMTVASKRNCSVRSAFRLPFNLVLIKTTISLFVAFNITGCALFHLLSSLSVTMNVEDLQIELRRDCVSDSGGRDDDDVGSIVRNNSRAFAEIRDEAPLSTPRSLQEQIENLPWRNGYWKEHFVAESTHCGEGAHGEVFRSVRKSDNCQYAVKRIKRFQGFQKNTPEFLTLCTKLFREVQILKEMESSNTVKFYDSWLEEVPDKDPVIYLYIQMELCKEDVKRYVKRNDDDNDALIGSLEDFIEIAKALVHVHGHGVVHRDVKLQNCFLGMDGKVKLGDFGTGRFLPPKDPRKLSPVTRFFASPEQKPKQENFWDSDSDDEDEDDYDYNQSADIFCLGLLVIELLCNIESELEITGVLDRIMDPPEEGNGLSQDFWKNKFDSKISEDLETAVLKMLDLDPNSRPSAADVVEEMKSLLEKVRKSEQTTME